MARTAASGSPSLTSASPTSTTPAPSEMKRWTSSTPVMPLSATFTTSAWIWGARRPKTPGSTSRVLRLRLLTPISSASSAWARSASASSWTSTRTVRPNSPASSCRRRRVSSSRAATISRARSAPAARASTSWSVSTMKSLRRSGVSTAARTARRSARLPPKRRSSVRTEIAAAPPSAYAVASADGSGMSARSPLLGLRRLTSAMTLEPRARKCGIGSRGAGASARCASSSGSGRAASRRARS